LLTGGTVPVPVVYSLPTAVSVLPGEVYSTEIVIRSTGGAVHNVMGQVSGLQDQAVYPRRHSARRDSSATLAPATIATGFSYASDVPFMEFGVTAGDVAIPRSPSTTLYNTAGTRSLPVPSWANTVQVIAVGAGGGGKGGTSTFGVEGEGGDNGAWVTGTWTRGTHFAAASSPSISIVTVNGGGGGSGAGGNGAAASSSTVTLPATSGHGSAVLTATGGTGGNNWTSGSATNGQSPGNQVYDSITYVGGGTQSSNGGGGASPGGGGAGGGYIQAGGDGAPAAVWIRFKQ
jgi:hypothetical protein